MARALKAAFESINNVLIWAPYSPDRATFTSPQQIKLPGLLGALPDAARDFRVSSLCSEATESSNEWARKHVGLCPSRVNETELAGDNPSDTTEGKSHADENAEIETLDLKTGLLASMCFPKADFTQLMLCAVYLAWTWLLDLYLEICNRDAAKDCIEEIIRLAENEPGSAEIYKHGFAKGLQEILRCLERSPESKPVYDRFRAGVCAYLQLLCLQHSEPSTDKSTTLKNYVAHQREAGWHTLLFILIEYAYGLESISEELRRKSTLKSIRDTAAEAIIYALDIYACAGGLLRPSVSHVARHNCITLLAQEQKINTRQAIEYSGELCTARLHAFRALQTDLLRETSMPIDSNTKSEIEIYVRALGDCVRGVLHWVFESERYFGQDGAYTRMTLTVELDSSGNGTPDEVVEE